MRVAPTVRILLFATAREAVGRANLRRELPDGGAGIESVLAELVRSYPRLGEVLRVSRVVLNGEILAKPTGRVRAGDEIAIYPPYSGG